MEHLCIVDRPKISGQYQVVKIGFPDEPAISLYFDAELRSWRQSFDSDRDMALLLHPMHAWLDND